MKKIKTFEDWSKHRPMEYEAEYDENEGTWDREDDMSDLLIRATHMICQFQGDCDNFEEIESPEIAIEMLSDLLNEIEDKELYKFAESLLIRIKEYRE